MRTNMRFSQALSTYAVFPPLRGIPDDVVASFMSGSKHLGGHVLVFGEPYLVLLVPAPIASMSN